MHVHVEKAISLLAIPVRILNKPVVKENIKNVAGALTCAFGLIEIYDLYQVSRGRVSTESGATAPQTVAGWVHTLQKVALVCAKVSLILSAGASRPGVLIISSLVGCVFSISQLNRVFGPSTTFAVNPWHPRHLTSIVAVIFALPALALSTYQAADWAYQAIWHHQQQNAPESPNTQPHAQQNLGQNPYLTNTKVKLINLFNTITSRPILHLGNQLCRSLR